MVISPHKRLISLEEKRQMWIDQNQCCYLCEKPVELDDTHIDHCHVTGKIRGIAHGRCNSGIGFFNDDPDQMAVVASNLRKANLKIRLTGVESKNP